MIRFGDRTSEVASATLELFHLYAEEAGFNLDVQLAGSADRLALEGRVRTPALPGPSELVVWYVDAPRVITIDEEHGTVSAEHPLPRLTVTSLDPGRVLISGTVILRWSALSGATSRGYPIELALDAALIT
ncbi:MAG: hypothetical protein H0T42_30815 [Deltaproteobacteria bacterium]|nr:hypothetical protein [Deltaproteobacteria bacterium]